MKWITVKLGDLLVAKFGVEEPVMLTELRVNYMQLIGQKPLVLTPKYPLTISVEDEAP